RVPARQNPADRALRGCRPKRPLHGQAIYQRQAPALRRRVGARTDPPRAAQSRIRALGRRAARLRRRRRVAARHRVKPPNISKLLLTWYGLGHRELPWRATGDPYRIWVSEIMLQQTRAQAVLPYYQRFLDRFPTLEDLAAASED